MQVNNLNKNEIIILLLEFVIKKNYLIDHF